jgi:hypothetical protein
LERDDGAPKRPEGPNMPPALPRPKPPVPGAPPPPRGTPRANPPPPPPAREATASAEADPAGVVDEDWLEPEDADEAALPPPAPKPPPPPPIAPPAPIIPPSSPSNPFLPAALPSPIASPPPIADVERTEPTPIASGSSVGDAKPTKAQSASESEAASSPFRKRSRARILAFVLVPALVVLGVGFVYRAQVNARAPKTERVAPQASGDATERVEPPALSTEPPPPPTHTAESPPSASAPKKTAAGAGPPGAAGAAALSADPSKTGIVDATALPAGRKIVIDGRLVGTAPRRVVVRCGVHRFQMGDLPPETLELPCGGEISFTE